ncbi:hypothetical protein D1007_35499 [Hordeum vulgare]|nr:hypothetical protein D1007_35499 [Hordeum vulgare]
MDSGGVRPSLPSAAAVGGASVPDEPRDARVVRELLRSMGLGEGEYEPRVVGQFLDLAYRYVGDVLGDAQVYADHAAKPQIDADDVRLAIQANVNFSFSQPPPRELRGLYIGDSLKNSVLDGYKLKVLQNVTAAGSVEMTLNLGSKRSIELLAYYSSDVSAVAYPWKVKLTQSTLRNKIPLPKSIAPPGSIPLPPEQDTLLSENYQLLPTLKPPTQTEEAEDDNEGDDAIPTNPSPNYSQDQRGSGQPQPQSQSQRVSFQLNAVAAAAAKHPLVTTDQLNMG